MARRRFPQYLPYVQHYADLETPLLRAIAKRGGAIWFSTQGGEIEVELADHFKLPQELRDLTDPEVNSEGHRVWRVMIQYARRKLVERGDLDMPERDRWRMTAQGYEWIGQVPPAQIS
jgi:Mrr restriction endonuclease-like protein